MASSVASGSRPRYALDTSRLAETMRDPSKTPLVLVACGSFSPITFLHLRMFEMARDHAHSDTDFEVVGGYLSPVNDSYGKVGLAQAEHRIAMCKLATETSSDWIALDDWEATRDEYSPTAVVLDHFEREINGDEGRQGIAESVGGPRRPIRIMLLAGSDLIQTMSVPGLWAEKDLHHILNQFGCYIVQRADSEIDQALFNDSAVHSRSPLALYRDNIHQVQQLIRNDVSSTKVRLLIAHGMSIRYLIPSAVIDYIRDHGLYRQRRPGQADRSKGQRTDSVDDLPGQAAAAKRND